MLDALSQGQKANKTGHMAEQVISDLLSHRGYRFARQYPACQSVFETPLKVDFFIFPTERIQNGLIIESKWQQVGGSVDEKLPYLVLNIKERFPSPTLIMIDGGGFREGAVTWLRNQVDGKTLIAVCTLGELLAWCNRNL